MGKKVKVVTKCGETFVYEHDQEVETVEIVEGNVLIKGDHLHFDEVPKYHYFQLTDKKTGKFVTAAHISTEEGAPRNFELFFTDCNVTERS